MSVTVGVCDVVIPIRDRLRGKLGTTKVPRYRPGRAPEWADNVVEEGMVKVWALDKTHEADSDMVRCDDSRLRRLKGCRTDNREKVIADHKRFRQADSVKEEENVRPTEEEVKRKRTGLQQEDALLLPEEDEDEEESEYDDEPEDSSVLCPIFVTKKERLTIAMQDGIDSWKLALKETEERRTAELKAEAKKLVVEAIKKDENIQRNLYLEVDIAEDVDKVNAADDYKAWMMREVSRIKRDIESRKPDEKIIECKRKKPRIASAPKRQRRRFMQVYYHKGVFFQSDADDPSGTAGASDFYRRDFSAPTREDKMNKTILPKVMQVKHFGRIGRIKWTHLVNEDTTHWNSPWAFSSDKVY